MSAGEIEEWFKHYSGDVKTFLVYFLRRTDVDDLVQETFIRAMRGQGMYRQSASPKTWLLAIARNLAVDWIRAERRVPSMSDIQNLELISVEHAPEDVAILREEIRIVMRELMALPKIKREVILLRTMMGLSASETADILGWSRARVNVTYHRSLKLLKRNLGVKENQHESNEGRS